MHENRHGGKETDMKKGVVYDIQGILPNGVFLLKEVSPEDYDEACRVLEEAEQEQQDGSLFEDDPMVDDRK